MIALADLLVAPTEEQILELLVDYLDGLDFDTQSWQPGSWQLHLLQLAAKVGAEIGANVTTLARAGFVGLSEGDLLTVVAREVYGVERGEGTATQGVFTLTSSAGAPLHTIGVGELVVADAPTDPAHTYRNTAALVLAPGTTDTIPVTAESAGADHNIASGSALYLWTPLVGVTPTNPAPAGEASWISVPGTDPDLDPRLAALALGRWDLLSYSVGDGAYRVWALEADASVTDVRVEANNPFGPGSVLVTIRTAVGGASAALVQTVSDYIHGTVDDVGRRPLNDVVLVQSATVVGRSIEVDVVVRAAAQEIVSDAAVQALVATYCAELPIGGLVVPPATLGQLVESEIVARIHALSDDVISASVLIGTPTLNPYDVVDPFTVVTRTLV